MKKLLAILLAGVMVMSLLTACGDKTQETKAPETKAETTAETKSETKAESAKETAEETKADSPAEAMLSQVQALMEEQLGDLPEEGKNEKIGVLIISLTNQFWVNMKDCYEAAAKELGVTVDVQTGTTEGDTQSQLDALMTMATMDYDVIIVSPIDGTNLIPGIVKCNEAGIPVINLGPGVDTEALEAAGGHLDAKITVKFEEQGQTVAEDMISRLPDGGQVAILEGLSGAGQSTGRTKGAADVFNSTEGIELVASQPCDWDATLAYDATKDILQANPELKGIFACNDVMALAAVEALQAEGRTDVMVYGVDYTDDAKTAIEAGTMTGSMTYSSAIYTKAALLMGMKLAQGGSYEEPLYLPLTLVNVDNVKDFEGWK